MIDEPLSSVAIRIRFAGSQAVDNYRMSPKELMRFYTDWKAYLSGTTGKGGEYVFEESDKPILVSMNFSLIAYIEGGKIY